MFKNKDNKKRVTDFIKSTKPRSTNHKVMSQDEYLDGIVAQVTFDDNSKNITQWVVITDKHQGYADSESQLIQQMGTAHNAAKGKFDWLNQVFNIAGFIALILVGTSVYITLTSEDGNIPEHLKALVLTIVGFYFGGLTQRKGSKKVDA